MPESLTVLGISILPENDIITMFTVLINTFFGQFWALGLLDLTQNSRLSVSLSPGQDEVSLADPIFVDFAKF